MGVAGKKLPMAAEVKQLRQRVAFLEGCLGQSGNVADEEEDGPRSKRRRRQARTESDDEEPIPE